MRPLSAPVPWKVALGLALINPRSQWLRLRLAVRFCPRPSARGRVCLGPCTDGPRRPRSPRPRARADRWFWQGESSAGGALVVLAKSPVRLSLEPIVSLDMVRRAGDASPGRDQDRRFPPEWDGALGCGTCLDRGRRGLRTSPHARGSLTAFHQPPAPGGLACGPPRVSGIACPSDRPYRPGLRRGPQCHWLAGARQGRPSPPWGHGPGRDRGLSWPPRVAGRLVASHLLGRARAQPSQAPRATERPTRLLSRIKTPAPIRGAIPVV